MPTRRYYSNAAPQLNLALPLSSGSTSLTIGGSFVGWPVSFPFFATLDRGTASAEIVSVTAAAGTIATVLRAQDGTSAISHPSGSTLDMTVVRLDMDEANLHVTSTGAAHGVAGTIVGTTDTQTLSNKTFTGTTTFGNLNCTGVTNLTGSLLVVGPSSVVDLSVSGALTTPGGTVTLAALSVPGAATVGGALGVTGVTTLHNLAIVAGSTVTGLPQGRGFIGETYTSTHTTLTTVFTRYPLLPLGGVVFTLTETRRIRISSMAQFLASTSVDTQYVLYGGYNTGSTITTPIGATQLEATRTPTVTVDSTFASGISHDGTILLAAGTYTAYPVGYRNGGSAGDCVGAYVAVYDVGNS